MQENIDNYTKEQLYNTAFFDSITGHYNWNWMYDHIFNFENYGITDFCLIHFDVKDFKMINEIYGHVAGDNVLINVVKAINKLKWCYFSCRCDNDNFVMMVPKFSQEELYEKLMNLFNSISVLDEDKDYQIFYRAGVVSVNIDTIKAERVYITDMAKFAKSLGTKANVNEIHFYTDEMKEEEFKGKLLKNELNRAFNNNEFLVYYQPKYNPKTNELVGAEALIRWNYNLKELWSPNKFVPYLEKENVIWKIDLFVLEEVCKNLQLWKNNGYNLVPISVNMSKTQLYSKNIISNINSIVNKYDIDKKYIEFELTESIAYDDITYMLKVLNQLRNEGFLLSIDDFGTGYSSLSLLSSMPITGLKIDKSFIDELEKSNSKSKIKFIIKDIVHMTKHLKINSLAEGVETENQKNLIRDWGCDSIQGYFYSKPLNIIDFEKLLTKN